VNGLVSEEQNAYVFRIKSVGIRIRPVYICIYIYMNVSGSIAYVYIYR
jgi:hypothetical protein